LRWFSPPARRIALRPPKACDEEERPVSPGEYLIRGVLLTDDPGGLPSDPVRIAQTPDARSTLGADDDAQAWK